MTPRQLQIMNSKTRFLPTAFKLQGALGSVEPWVIHHTHARGQR